MIILIIWTIAAIVLCLMFAWAIKVNDYLDKDSKISLCAFFITLSIIFIIVLILKLGVFFH